MDKKIFFRRMDSAEVAAGLERDLSGSPAVLAARVSFANLTAHISVRSEKNWESVMEIVRRCPGAEAEAVRDAFICEYRTRGLRNENMAVSVKSELLGIEGVEDVFVSASLGRIGFCAETQEAVRAAEEIAASYGVDLEPHREKPLKAIPFRVRVTLAALSLLLLVGGLVLSLFQAVNAVKILTYSLYVISALLSVVLFIADRVNEARHGCFAVEKLIVPVGALSSALLGFYGVGAAFVCMDCLYGVLRAKVTDGDFVNEETAGEKTATVLYEEKTYCVCVQDILPGDKLLVEKGAQFPVDCTLASEYAVLDTRRLDGNRMPAEKSGGERIRAGSVNLGDAVTAIAVSIAEESSFAKNQNETERILQRRNKERMAKNSILRYYFYGVLSVFLVVGVLIPLALLIFGQGPAFADWLNRGLLLLTIACPCETFFAAPFAALRNRSLCKRMGAILQTPDRFTVLDRVDFFACDRAGILTEGKPQITRKNCTDAVYERVCALQAQSVHPLACVFDAPPSDIALSDFRELPGLGVCGCLDNAVMIVGNEKFMHSNSVSAASVPLSGRAYYVVYGEDCVGYVLVDDPMRQDVPAELAAMAESGIKTFFLLTSENAEVAVRFAEDAQGIDTVCADLHARKKAECMMALRRDKKGTAFLYAGAGTDDLAAMGESDFTLAIDGVSAKETLQVADIVLQKNLKAVPQILKLAKRTRSALTEMGILAVVLKAICFVFGLIGVLPVPGLLCVEAVVVVLSACNVLRIRA